MQLFAMPLCMALPRTRGDGPVSFNSFLTLLIFAPHTRGWSRFGHNTMAKKKLCPAHAGMVPPLILVLERTPTLPRTRGDGPMGASYVSRYDVFAPHTRGWSPSGKLFENAIVLCPAHAGMVPGVHCACAWKVTLPRTRGDGPGLVARPFSSESFASYAGECNDRLKINFHPLEDGIGGVTGEYRLPFAPQLSA